MRGINRIGSAFVFAVLAVGLALAVNASQVNALQTRNGNDAYVSKDETIDDTLYTAGNTINVSGTVNGDVYCAGQSVVISGTINGDLICAAQSIRVTGQIKGDVRLASQIVDISGQVESNASVFTQSFTLQQGASVGGDMTLFASNASIDGRLGRDLYASLDNLVVSGNIVRNGNFRLSMLTLRPTSNVGGVINYISTNEATVDAGATVTGGLSREAPVQASKGQLAGAAAIGFGYTFISLLIVSLVLILIAPQKIHAISERGRGRPGKSVLYGFLLNIAVGPIVALLLLTTIGAPLALLVGLGWLAIITLSGPMLAYLIGRLVMKKQKNPIVVMLVGAVLLLLLSFIPLVNIVLILAVVIYGSGMITVALFDWLGRPRYKLK